jgi:hypothetical protein
MTPAIVRILNDAPTAMVGTDFQLSCIEVIGDGLDVQAFPVLLDYLRDLIDVLAVLEDVPELLHQSPLLAGVDLNENDLIHRRSHYPDVVSLINVVYNITGGLDGQLQANLGLVGTVLNIGGKRSGAAFSVEVDYLNEVVVLHQEVPSLVVVPIALLPHLPHPTDQLHVDLGIVLDQIGLVAASDL